MKQAKLKSAIKMAGLTQAEVAELIGISAHSMNLKLNNRTPFTLDEAFKICGILGVNNPKGIFEIKGW